MGANPFVFIPSAFRRLLWEIVYFPIHYYTRGLLSFSRAWTNFVSGRLQLLGFSVWLKNIFVPMYGQRDFAGRLISFLMRLVQIIFRGLLSGLLLVFYVLVILVYLSLLLDIIIGLFLL